MRKKASLIVADVKAYANSQTDPAPVYVAASISQTDPPSPAAPPEQPTDLSASLGADGSVTINFSGRGIAGTVWEVSRQLEGETTYSHLGHADTATKSFTDSSVPGTVSSATYRVHGVRGSVSGPNSAGYAVQFGGTDGATESAEAA